MRILLVLLLAASGCATPGSVEPQAVPSREYVEEQPITRAESRPEEVELVATPKIASSPAPTSNGETKVQVQKPVVDAETVADNVIVRVNFLKKEGNILSVAMQSPVFENRSNQAIIIGSALKKLKTCFGDLTKQDNRTNIAGVKITEVEAMLSSLGGAGSSVAITDFGTISTCPNQQQ